MKRLSLLLTALALMMTSITALANGSATSSTGSRAGTICTDVTFPIDEQQANNGNGTGSLATGTGTYSLDTTNNVLTWTVEYQSDVLSGTVTAAHFHGPAPAGSPGDVQIGIGTNNPATGSSGISAADVSDILDDLWYVNIHTSAFGGGEIRGQVDGAACTAQLADCPSNIVINEVDADTTGTDTMEFIELYDGGTGDTSLNGCVVVLFNGNNDDKSYNAIDLDGFSTDANGYFVMGNPNVPSVDLVIGNSNAIQNGADAVALYNGNAADFPNNTLPTTTNLISALVYDTSDADDSSLLTALGETFQYNEDANGAKDTESIQRIQETGEPPASRDNDQQYGAGTPSPDEQNDGITPIIPTAVALVGAAINHATFPIILIASMVLLTLTFWLKRKSV